MEANKNLNIENQNTQEKEGVIGTVCVVAWAILGAVATVDYYVEKLSGKDIATWASENSKIPYTPYKIKIRIISSDGNVFNPYPPNSYQGAIWKQNNFRVEIIG